MPPFDLDVLEWDWRTGLMVAGCMCFAFLPIFTGWSATNPLTSV
ncbi:MAG: hypothetical protein CM15mP103_06900 [Gammaproteobacteria bacterium]|nr:MAG: hypothetical protein CM15mP103_06900 [Gammaproteobacteria bacterium]